MVDPQPPFFRICGKQKGYRSIVVPRFSFLALFAHKQPSERRELGEKLFVWRGSNYGISPLA